MREHWKRIICIGIILSLYLVLQSTFSFAETKWNLSKGPIEITNSKGVITLTQNGKSTDIDNNPVIYSSGQTSNTLTIRTETNTNYPTNITLAGVNIVSSSGAAIQILLPEGVSASNAAMTQIELDDSNTVKAGAGANAIYRKIGSLKITDSVGTSGTLVAKGADSSTTNAGSGIYVEGTNGELIITGGKISVSGGVSSSSSAGGLGMYAKNITISGGRIDARGGNNTNTTGSSGTGINAGKLIIQGDAVIENAIGGNSIAYSRAGQGIWGREIIIKDQAIIKKAQGGTSQNDSGACGIYAETDDLTISGGIVNAKGGNTKNSTKIPGMGIYFNSQTKAIKITGGTVNAVIGSGGTGKNYAIGGYSATISGGAVVVANSTNSKGISSFTAANSIVIENNEGKMYGNVSISFDAEIPSGTLLPIDGNSTLAIPAGKTLVNRGTITNEGIIRIQGSLINYGTIEDKGTIYGQVMGAGSGKVNGGNQCTHYNSITSSGICSQCRKQVYIANILNTAGTAVKGIKNNAELSDTLSQGIENGYTLKLLTDVQWTADEPLLLEGNGYTINLNSHTIIRRTSAKNIVRVEGSDITIMDGTIRIYFTDDEENSEPAIIVMQPTLLQSVNVYGSSRSEGNYCTSAEAIDGGKLIVNYGEYHGKVKVNQSDALCYNGTFYQGVELCTKTNKEDLTLFNLLGTGKAYFDGNNKLIDISKLIPTITETGKSYILDGTVKVGTHTHSFSSDGQCDCGWKDAKGPEVDIKVGQTSIKAVSDNHDYKGFFKLPKNITISAKDKDTGVQTVEYIATDNLSSVDEAFEWKKVKMENGAGNIEIDSNIKGKIYVRAVDEIGNITIACSEGIVVYSDAGISDSELKVKKSTTNDLIIPIELNGNGIHSMSINKSEVTEIIDCELYEIRDEGIILKTQWLNNLDEGKHTINLEINPMGESYVNYPENDAPDMLHFILEVEAGPTPLTVTAFARKAYDGTTDVDLDVTFGGLENEETLIKNVDYTVEASFDNANAGKNKRITAKICLIDNEKTRNYQLDKEYFEFAGEIIKGELENIDNVFLRIEPNKKAIYELNLTELLPILDEGEEYGEIFFTASAQNLSGDYSKIDTNVNEGVLIFSTPAIQTPSGNIGSIIVNMSSNNYVDIILKIQVRTYLYGSLNYDDQVDAADVLFLRRHLAKWKTYTNVSVSLADLDADGVVTIRDLTILERHIAGWEGYESLPVTVETLPIFS